MPQELSEQWIIRRVAKRFAELSDTVATAIGDDAAVLRLKPDTTQRQLLTTHTLIEGVHFDLRYMSLTDVGYKALAVNLSDINAMGGESIAALGTLGVPPHATESDIEALLDGIAAALQLAKDAGQTCALIGGDTVAAPQWMIGFTVLGSGVGEPLLRSGAKTGDLIWHSGWLGLSGIGLLELQRGLPTQVQYPQSLAAHRRPSPELALGPWLQKHGYASAAMDLSDSLSQVALQLGAASKVGFRLEFDGYCWHEEVVAYKALGAEAEFILAQAEDYGLLFTAPEKYTQQLLDAPFDLTNIGQVVDANKGNSYVDELGLEHPLFARGFEHL